MKNVVEFRVNIIDVIWWITPQLPWLPVTSHPGVCG